MARTETEQNTKILEKNPRREIQKLTRSKTTDLRVTKGGIRRAGMQDQDSEFH